MTRFPALRTKSILLLTIKNRPELADFFDLNNCRKEREKCSQVGSKKNEEKKQFKNSENSETNIQSEYEYSNKRLSFTGAVVVFSVQKNTNTEGKNSFFTEH